MKNQEHKNYMTKKFKKNVCPSLVSLLQKGIGFSIYVNSKKKVTRTQMCIKCYSNINCPTLSLSLFIYIYTHTHLCVCVSPLFLSLQIMVIYFVFENCITNIKCITQLISLVNICKKLQRQAFNLMNFDTLNDINIF